MTPARLLRLAHLVDCVSSHGPRLVHNVVCRALICAVIGCGIVTAPLLLSASVAWAVDQNQGSETVRPEVGNPLQAAQELIKGQKYKAALAKIQEADSAKDKTPYERYVIDRLRATAATGAGDVELAVKSFESAIASGRVSSTEKLKMMEASASLYYRAKDYPDAIAWASRYRSEGGTGEEMHRLLIQAYYLNNDFTKAQTELRSEIQADESARRAPPEDRLQP